MNYLDEWLLFAQTKQSVLDDQSLKNLLENYEKLKAQKMELFQLKKLLAETCFLVAKSYKKINQFKAQQFAEESIHIYKCLNVETLEDAVPILSVLLPDLMHEDVVRNSILGR